MSSILDRMNSARLKALRFCPVDVETGSGNVPRTQCESESPSQMNKNESVGMLKLSLD